MTLEHAFFVSQIIAAIAIVASLLFVGKEIRENTHALQRDEHNSTMEQWTVIRMAITKDREVAELVAFGLVEDRPLEAAEQLRLEQLLSEVTWAAFHIWDRTQRGIFPKGTFEFTGAAYLCSMLATRRGGAWWQRAKHHGLLPDFVADVDRQLAAGSKLPLIFAGPATATATGVP